MDTLSIGFCAVLQFLGVTGECLEGVRFAGGVSTATGYSTPQLQPVHLQACHHTHCIRQYLSVYEQNVRLWSCGLRLTVGCQIIRDSQKKLGYLKF